jgi:hypothetical protein
MTRRTSPIWPVAVLLLAGAARAQSGGPYNLSWSTVDGGGKTFASGGPYTLGSTAGQPDAGVLSGGSYQVAGGFWCSTTGALLPTATPGPTSTPTPTITPGGPTLTPTPTPPGGTVPASDFGSRLVPMALAILGFAARRRRRKAS